MATIHDVAHEAGVSISTVSYALTGKRSVSEATRKRVEEAALTLKYLPNAGARMMGGTRSHIFALTAPMRHDTNPAVHMSFVLSLVNEARKFDYDVLLMTEDEATRGLERVTKSRLVDGIILLDVAADDERVELVRDLPIPSITIGVPDNTDGLICVDLDFRAVGEIAVRTLAEYGHRSIALVGQAEETYGRGATFPLRLRNGFDEAAARRGINTHFVFGDSNGGRLRARLEDLFNKEHPPTALVLNCDEFGHKTVESYLAAKGLRVPDDVSLLSAGTSFDMDELDIPLDTIDRNY